MSWWKNGIVYQIYPRSFMDSNGDGVGDLRGIANKIDYLAWLGVDALWLSPIFPSPMRDFGYDVSNYTDIDPLFGTLDDFDYLLEEAHGRGMKIILDLVPNHTSSDHPWFKESRSSRDNPKRDWYIWRDPKPDGSPPNNWLAYFGGPAWTKDEATGQYYLHNFLPEQPDLNYRNPEVIHAMQEQIRFWLERGVDGFRIDVVDRMIKDDQFRDNPPNPDYVPGKDNPMWSQKREFSENRPEVHPLIAEFRKTFDAYHDRVSIGEIAYSTDPNTITSFYGTPEAPELHLPFNFAYLLLPWDAARLRDFNDRYDAALRAVGGWGNNVTGNHDQPRVATRIGAGQARVAAMLILTLRGTPFIYQGEELGLPDVEIPPEKYQDPQGINTGVSRDGCRSPMPWNAAAHAGFSTVEPWLPLTPDYAALSIEAQKADRTSMLNLYRALIDLRRSHSALQSGDYRSYDAPEGVLLYERSDASGSFLIALNLTAEPRSVTLPRGGTIQLTTRLDRSGESVSGTLELQPDEGVIVS